MEDRKKAGVGIALTGLAAGGALVFALSRKAEAVPPPPGEGAATIVITVYDSQGNPVPSNSPFNLDEGGSYTIVLTVTNQSTKGGQAWAATLGVWIGVIVDSIELMPVTGGDYVFAAEETQTFSYTLSVPISGYGGKVGQITASVISPNHVTIAGDVEYINIVTLEVVYGATIVIS